MSFNAKEVRVAAQGNWDRIFSAFAPELKAALEHPGRHVPCPVHGGADGFRLYKDFAERGMGVCNTCGPKNDGFEMLMWLKGWDFKTTVNAVGDYLGLDDREGQGTYKALPAAEQVKAAGQLVQHGAAPFQFKEGASQSYFVTLAAPGRREPTTLWGADLAKAVRIAHVEPGMWIECCKAGQWTRTVEGRTRTKAAWFIRQIDDPKVTEEEARRQRAFDLQCRRRIEQVWTEAEEYFPGTRLSAPIERYLASRKITLSERQLSSGECFRFSRSTPYFDAGGKKVGSYPAMVCAVRAPDGRIVSVHRTYLTPDGRKAPVAAPKKLMQIASAETVSGCAIRFGKPISIMAVAEGIETSLSVSQALRIPCWSTISATGMASFVPPKGIQLVLIMADKDLSGTGEKAARELQSRLEAEGIASYLLLPKEPIPEGAKGIDWNDVLRTKGPAGFPKLFSGS